jgi:hypothetical protein
MRNEVGATAAVFTMLKCVYMKMLLTEIRKFNLGK